MRLRQTNLSECGYKKFLRIEKDSEGNRIPEYSEEIPIKAEIWDAGSKLQTAIYGIRINRIKNMLYDGAENIQEGDLVALNGEDYKVISSKGKCPKTLEIEKLL